MAMTCRLSFCLRCGCFLVRMCCLNGLRRNSLPVAVGLKRFVAERELFSLMCFAFSFLGGLVGAVKRWAGQCQHASPLEASPVARRSSRVLRAA